MCNMYKKIEIQNTPIKCFRNHTDKKVVPCMTP